MFDLALAIADSCRGHASRPALALDGRVWSYLELYQSVAGLAALLADRRLQLERPPRVGILAERSLLAYQGVLAAVLAGATYVPLSSAQPAARLQAVVDRAGLDFLLVEPASDWPIASALLARTPRPVIVVVPATTGELPCVTAGSPHRLMRAPVAAEGRPDGWPAVDPAAPLYLMFTSGTTGEPKGILVSRGSVASYLQSVGGVFGLGPGDRCSQFFRLTFDLSVHDLLVTWLAGACLHVPNDRELLDPVAFCQRHALTAWFSVPSMAALAASFGKLKPGCLPSLRHVLFCGEALSAEVAAAMAAAAPAADLTNLYGPTEATIAITRYRLPPPPDQGAARPAAVPIGQPFPGQRIAIVDERLRPVGDGRVGELLLAGDQLALGYHGDPAQTAARFPVLRLPGDRPRRWFRTGDLVQADPARGLLFRGRNDDQIKLRGYRIELGEVEAALRQAAGTGLAVVAAWPPSDLGTADQLIGFVCPPHAPLPEVSARLAQLLPAYMRPRRIVSAERPRLSPNHKLDRRQFVRHLTPTEE